MKSNYRSLDDLLNDCTIRVKTKGGHGTGFFVAPGLILTCAHVIDDAFKQNTPISAYCNYDHETIEVGQIGMEDVFPDPYPDLALLRADINDHPCVLLGTEFHALTNFYSYGSTRDYPDGESTILVCEGTLEYGGTFIKLKDGQVKPGTSGSPLLNIATGAVCGMITNTRDRNSDLGGAGVPMEIIFAKFPQLKQLNQAFHHFDTRWKGLLKSEISALKIFLCHASDDKPAVIDLYHQLRNEGFDPWLDKENLLAGQEWQEEIPKAVRTSDVVLVCLSRNSVNKAGYVQKEIKYALDKADEQPEGTVFIIPLKLEECDVPNRLSKWQWVMALTPP